MGSIDYEVKRAFRNGIIIGVSVVIGFVVIASYLIYTASW